MGGCNFAGHGGIPFLMIPVFSHFQQVSLPWGWGEDQMPLKRPDGRWSVIKINVINELPLLVSAGGSAPELMGTFAETEGHLLFYSTGCLINPNVPARIMNGRNGYCMEKEWGGIIANNRYAGHAGIPLHLKCTGDGGLACRDEGKNIFLEGSRPIGCSLIQRDERFLAFFLGFPKMVFHIPCERRNP